MGFFRRTSSLETEAFDIKNKIMFMFIGPWTKIGANKIYKAIGFFISTVILLLLLLVRAVRRHNLRLKRRCSVTMVNDTGQVGGSFLDYSYMFLLLVN